MLEDGDIISAGPRVVAAIGDSAPVGKLVLDGTRLVPMNGRGHVGASPDAVQRLDCRQHWRSTRQGNFAAAGLRISAPGLLDPDDADTSRVADEFAETLRDLPANLRRDDQALQEAARAALRRTLGRRLGKRPLVDVHLIRV